jgi:hypothetical protein
LTPFRTSTHASEDEELWRRISADLVGSSGGTLVETVKDAIEEAGRRLATACWSEEDSRSRATSLTSLATKLFGSSESSALEAVRGLLVVRGCGDWYSGWFPHVEPERRPGTPSFRVHTFFRSIEGLLAPGYLQELCLEIL